MTDIYSDELYSPSFAASSSHPQTGHVPVSPNNEMFAQRLQAANSQHLNAVHSPVVAVSRERSPFRHGPPLAPSPSHDFGSGMAAPGVHHHGRFNSAQQMRERRNAEQDARAMRQQMARGPDTANPQTISPKDAMLEFHDGDGDANADPNSHSDTNANFPQFPQASGETDPSFTAEEINKAVAAVVAVHEGHGYDGSGGMGLDTTGFGYAPGIQVPQQYPFIAQTSLAGRPPSMGQLRIGSAESGSSASGGTGLGRRVGVSASGSASGSSSASGSRSSPAMNSPRRPTAGLNADGGTYTCTYHGCTLRFETPALLQKHKREDHRQAHGLGARGRRADGSTGVAPSASAGTGAGPGSGSGSVGGSAGQTGGSGMTSSLLNTQEAFKSIKERL